MTHDALAFTQRARTDPLLIEEELCLQEAENKQGQGLHAWTPKGGVEGSGLWTVRLQVLLLHICSQPRGPEPRPKDEGMTNPEICVELWILLRNGSTDKT